MRSQLWSSFMIILTNCIDTIHCCEWIFCFSSKDSTKINNLDKHKALWNAVPVASKFHDFFMTFDAFSKFHDFPWLFMKTFIFPGFPGLPQGTLSQPCPHCWCRQMPAVLINLSHKSHNVIPHCEIWDRCIVEFVQQVYYIYWYHFAIFFISWRWYDSLHNMLYKKVEILIVYFNKFIESKMNQFQDVLKNKLGNPRAMSAVSRMNSLLFLLP